jgi:hypothetical protein
MLLVTDAWKRLARPRRGDESALRAARRADGVVPRAHDIPGAEDLWLGVEHRPWKIARAV